MTWSRITMHNYKLQNHHLQQHLLISTDSLPDSLSKKACSSLRCGRLRFRYVQLAKDIVLAVMKFKLTHHIYWSIAHVTCWKQFRPIKPLKSVLRYICSNIIKIDRWVVLLRGGIDQTHPAVCHTHGHLRISAAGSPTHLDLYKHTLHM